MISSITVLAFLPWLFGYGSMTEAEAACKKWADKGVTHHYTYVKGRLSYPNKVYSRWCKLEEVTNQYLGMESRAVARAKDWDDKQDKPEYTVSKRFRF